MRDLSTPGPSTFRPPSGFGRSRMIISTPSIAGLAVEGENGNAGAGVDGLSLDVLAGVGIATDPVFRAEEGDQLHSRSAVQHIDGGVEVAVHAGGIGHQPDALALQLLEAVGLEDVDAGEDGLGGAGGGDEGKGGQDEDDRRG